MILRLKCGGGLLIQTDLKTRFETGLKSMGTYMHQSCTYLSHFTHWACISGHVKVALQVESEDEAAVVEHVEAKKETNRLYSTIANCINLPGAKIEFSRSSLVSGTVHRHLPVRFLKRRSRPPSSGFCRRCHGFPSFSMSDECRDAPICSAGKCSKVRRT